MKEIFLLTVQKRLDSFDISILEIQNEKKI